MAEREPVAFFSYVRSDDAHDFGRISELRRSLEGEVKMQTGFAFHIFQDRNDITWGEQWKERIESALRGVTFLIPIEISVHLIARDVVNRQYQAIFSQLSFSNEKSMKFGSASRALKIAWRNTRGVENTKL